MNISPPNNPSLPRLSRFLSLAIFLLFFFHSLPAQIPSGYYNSAEGLSGAPLKTALHKIIRGHTKKTYAQVWTAFYTTDDKTNGKVWDIYSDVPGGTPAYEYTFGTNQCGNADSEGDCYSREHSFPKSWFNGVESDTMYSDIFHLYPVDQYVNMRRSNNPYGTVSSPTWTSTNGGKLGPCSTSGYAGTVFEPISEYKGDLARTYFYMATRYESRIASWQTYDVNGDAVLNGTPYPVFETWFLNLLLAWHTADPVSQKEIDRNNAVYGIQGNRNPFIDHPEYVAAIWTSGSETKPEPSNYPTNVSGYPIHLQWTDATGAVIPTNYLIRMSSVGFGSIVTPTDGVYVPDGPNDRNIAYGIQEAWFYGLTANTTYFFKLFGYVYSDGGVTYKTDGSVPQIQQTTQP